MLLVLTAGVNAVRNHTRFSACNTRATEFRTVLEIVCWLASFKQRSSCKLYSLDYSHCG